MKKHFFRLKWISINSAGLLSLSKYKFDDMLHIFETENCNFEIIS